MALGNIRRQFNHLDKVCRREIKVDTNYGILKLSGSHIILHACSIQVPLQPSPTLYFYFRLKLSQNSKRIPWFLAALLRWTGMEPPSVLAVTLKGKRIPV